MKFIKAKYLGNKTVRYEVDSGEYVDYVGGTWAWRNNNPGNIIKGSFANKHGAIGDAGGFAVFSSYEVGENAQRSLLKIKKYQESKIWELIKAYAPKSDGNDPDHYTKLVKDFTGLDPDRLLKSLSDEEFEKVIKAIIRVEGYKKGDVKPVKLKKVLDTKSEKGVIVSYLVEEYGWISKSKAIEFAEKEIIDAVIVQGENGKHLRSRPDESTSNNFKN